MMSTDRLMRCNPWAWNYLDKYYFGINNNRISDPPENHSINQIAQINTHKNLINPINKENERTADSALFFANYLFKQQDYIRAIGEYKRLLFFRTDSTSNTNEYIQLMLGESYLNLKDYEQALFNFNLSDNPYSHYNRARVSFEQGNYLKTRIELDSVINLDFNEQQIVLYGMSFYKEHDFSTGAHFFKTHTLDSWSVINKLYNYDGHEIKKRNRIASTLFSAIIPGLGQVYSGRWGDGFYSFLTVVGSGLIANYYYHNDNSKIKFSIFSVFTIFFWAGNVYGANIAAPDYNTYQINQYLSKVDNELQEFDFMPNYKEIRK
jgi:tetratricopeptide (TPR) repeat protein